MRIFTKARLGKELHKLLIRRSPDVIKAFLESHSNQETADQLLKRLAPITESMAEDFFIRIMKELQRRDIDFSSLREELDNEGLMDWDKDPNEGSVSGK